MGTLAPGRPPAACTEVVVFAPALGRGARLVARLGAARTVVVGPTGRVVTTRGAAAVAAGAVAGMLAATPLDGVSLAAPLLGLGAGAAASGSGWLAVRGRHSVRVDAARWVPRVTAADAVLADATRIGQPFVSPAGLRATLHSALWHAATAEGLPGDDEVLGAFDEHVGRLGRAVSEALAELERPAIEARARAVSERLAAAATEIATLGASGRADGAVPDPG